MFTNLIINSIQAMRTAGSWHSDACGSFEMVRVWVRDTGQFPPEGQETGISASTQPPSPVALGLGLAGARKIMLELGGDISFSSEVGRGTQFDLIFPKAHAVQEDQAA